MKGHPLSIMDSLSSTLKLSEIDGKKLPNKMPHCLCEDALYKNKCIEGKKRFLTQKQEKRTYSPVKGILQKVFWGHRLPHF